MACTLALLAVLVFLIPQLGALFTARFLQGVAVALAVSSAPPAIAENLTTAPRGRAAQAAALVTIANLGGLGSGSLLSAIIVAWWGHPFTTPFLAFAVLLGSCGLWTLRCGLDYRRAHFHLRLPVVPAGGLLAYLGAGACGFAGFAAFSIYASLGPSILSSAFHLDGIFYGPLVYFAVMCCGAFGQLALIRLRPRTRRILGLLVFSSGFLLTAIGATTWLWLFIAGSGLLGLGAGVIFADASRTVIARARPETAAATQAGFFLMAYVGMIAPIVVCARLQEIVGTPAALLTTGLALSAIATGGLRASPDSSNGIHQGDLRGE